jgi:predicted GNAT family acetyltransferase
MPTHALCTDADCPAVLAFLEERAETSMFLLENLRTAGVGEGRPAYVASREGERVVGVASVNAGGVLLVQAPEDTAQAAARAVREHGAAIRGVLGPTEQVSAVLRDLGLLAAPARMHREERVYDRDLRTLAPRALPPEAEVRLATPADLDVLTAFSRAYLIEALGAAPDDAGLDAAASAEGARKSRDGATFVLVERGAISAMTAFTARYGGVVQVGGVFTPVGLRGRGLGRSVVAGSLAHARDSWGAERAVLFTAEGNTPAQRAYEALGFVRKGGYALLFFREPTLVAWKGLRSAED